jgi:L-amino acid N-acyltransferase YncA
VLEHEYDKRRRLPPALRQKTDPPSDFSYTIRPATAADLPHTLALYRHWVRNSVVTFDEKPPALREYRSRFAHYQKHGFPYLVAQSPRGDILGFAQVQPFRQKSAFRKTVESSIYLGPASTGRGLGSALLAELISACEQAGIREMVAVIADQGAEASLALHHRFGFVETGRMQKVGYKFERWVGIILMQKSLHPPR